LPAARLNYNKQAEKTPKPTKLLKHVSWRSLAFGSTTLAQQNEA